MDSKECIGCGYNYSDNCLCPCHDRVARWMDRIDKVMNIVGIIAIIGFIWIIVVIVSKSI